MKSSLICIRFLKAKDDHHFEVMRADNKKSLIGLARLQECCPRTDCSELQSTNRVRSFDSNIKARDIKSAGSYALRVGFEGGYLAGISTYEQLRVLSLGEF